jgi:hypothetical protein
MLVKLINLFHTFKTLRLMEIKKTQAGFPNLSPLEKSQLPVGELDGAPRGESQLHAGIFKGQGFLT